MSRIPILYNLLDDYNEQLMGPMTLHDDSFGLGIMPQYLRDLRRSRQSLLRNNDVLQMVKELDELRHFSELALQRGQQRSSAGGPNQPVCQIGNDGFQACMDVSQFKPKELNVKVVGNSIVVEGKHEEREDRHGHISRQFMRRYTLPKGYDPSAVVSALSSDGVLTVSAPKPAQLENKREERMIAIQQTGPAHLNVKENAQESVGDSNAEGKAKK